MEETVKDSGVDFLGSLNEVFGCEPQDVRTYSPLSLAYIGDAVFELVIRSVVMERGNRPVNALHRMTTRYVKAQAQAEMLQAIQGELTQEEESVCRRGRNANPYTKAKNATMKEYRLATGFEALVGYLYLTGQTARMLELIARAARLSGLES